MKKPTRESHATAPAHQAAARQHIDHPRSVPIFEEEGEVDAEADQPFEEGSHDAIDPDLRHRLISETAYELYKHRGYADGYDLDDWLQAEEKVDHMLLHPPIESVPESVERKKRGGF